MSHAEKSSYLVLVVFILVTQISNQTNEMRLKPLPHTGDVTLRPYAAAATEDACGVIAGYVNQSQEICNENRKLYFL